MTKQTQFYTLRALTPLHAGAGDANFGIIDKHVQRDNLTELPTIFASSLKGSLRQLSSSMAGVSDQDVTTIFGSDNAKGTQAGSDTLKQGEYIFYQAKLLALPIRSSHELWYLAITPPILRELLDDLEVYGVNSTLKNELEQLANMSVSQATYFGKNHGRIQLEDISAAHGGSSIASTLFGDRLAILPVNDFARLAKELPTIARNSLNNGISENLWYEEIVPREARFYFPVTAMAEDGGLLDAAVGKANNLVQIGGNATVGFGLCKWEKLQ
jgi:CRISPR-associated protein Cmr4